MKKGIMIVVALVVACNAMGQIIVQKVKGDVAVRHGVAEKWSAVAVGDVLKPDDTMRTGDDGTAVVKVASRQITLPREVIVDISDVRDLTQEELMLKLTMEKVRASSYQWKNEDLHIPNATVVHGANKSDVRPMDDNDPRTGVLELNGTKVLYDNGYYSTCALKALGVFRRFPALASDVDRRLMVAGALAKASLRGEALNEYASIAAMEGLTAAQLALVREKMNALKQ
jgi:hypothetical protein